jgi:hypothetical protein
MQSVIRPVIGLSTGEVKFNLVTASENLSAGYFVYGRQKCSLKQAQEANQQALFAVESHVLIDRLQF